MTKTIVIACLAALCGACGSESHRQWDVNPDGWEPVAGGSGGLAGSPEGGSGGETAVVVLAGAAGEQIRCPATQPNDGDRCYADHYGWLCQYPDALCNCWQPQPVEDSMQWTCYGPDAGVGGAGTSDGPGDGGTVAATGSTPGTGGTEVCECDGGPCCDGCHYLGPEVVCFNGAWSYCIPDAPPCAVGSYALTTIRATVFCSGLSPLCVYYPGGSERVEEPECCPRGTECQPHELVEVDPNYPPDPLPHAECI